MPDRIVYTATVQSGEFVRTPFEVAAFSRDDLDKAASGAWSSIDKKTIEPSVVDPDKVALEALKALTPIQKLCLERHFAHKRSRK